MNLDLVSSFNFGDVSGLRTFLLDHRTVHDQTAAALTLQLGYSVSSFQPYEGAEQAWEELMRNRQGPTPEALRDWLEIHATIHTNTYQILGGVGTVAPDLSVVDFSQPNQFYDWMYVHSQMHDYEQATLGLS